MLSDLSSNHPSLCYYTLTTFTQGSSDISEFRSACAKLKHKSNARLGFQFRKGGISRTTPSRLAPQLQSLPPILHIQSRKPMPSYSKGSRGLSVPLRVGSIFTATTISPRSSLRQFHSRYTIRAGRNLPDKEFRYLRTVIVTAAVYRGFGR